jgi:GntR family galactonate operon transcriptional repressor
VNDLTGVAGLLAQETTGNRERSMRRQRLATPVIEDFVDQIVSGHFPPGTDFPSEANICRYLGISRTVLREVLKVLEQKGLVRVENGKGTIVTKRDEWNLLDPVVLPARLRHDENGSFLDHLVRVRIALESDMAAEAAERATREQIEFMATKIIELQNSIPNLELYFRADRQFHDSFMRASGNELSRAIVLNIYNEARMRLESGLEDARLELSMLGHVEIYEAILAHDPERAAEAANHHIGGAWKLKLESSQPRNESLT